ncbi:sensor histidine kinase [Acetobacter senegalensis]|uniref:sensor histidine kinase n=1 Tax=Acetobacter senegalensis TaxID=446692 RepID=UPI00264EE188|nr:PAS domain-containing protein [Acetobacter senegalensis]MDN7352176.1 PAS domain-containing protein [Acetobacter senegalensis]
MGHMEKAAETYAKTLFPALQTVSPATLLDLQSAMLDATPDCIKVLSRDGTLLMMNQAGCLALNVPRESGFGMPWLSLLPPEVHEEGKKALSKAAEGKRARFQGKSCGPDGFMYWDNILIPLVTAAENDLTILCVSRDITQTTTLRLELEDALERERILTQEMQHRIGNLFSIVNGLVTLSEREAGQTDDAPSATHILKDKLSALARVSSLARHGKGDDPLQTDAMDLHSILQAVLQPYGARCALRGEALKVAKNEVTCFSLIFHELATNSMKYGALSSFDGLVSLDWKQEDSHLRFNWTETGGPPVSAPPHTLGFGSGLLDRLVRSAEGKVKREWLPEGLSVNLWFPNRPE